MNHDLPPIPNHPDSLYDWSVEEEDAIETYGRQCWHAAIEAYKKDQEAKEQP